MKRQWLQGLALSPWIQKTHNPPRQKLRLHLKQPQLWRFSVHQTTIRNLPASKALSKEEEVSSLVPQFYCSSVLLLTNLSLIPKIQDMIYAKQAHPISLTSLITEHNPLYSFPGHTYESLRGFAFLFCRQRCLFTHRPGGWDYLQSCSQCM